MKHIIHLLVVGDERLDAWTRASLRRLADGPMAIPMYHVKTGARVAEADVSLDDVETGTLSFSMTKSLLGDVYDLVNWEDRLGLEASEIEPQLRRRRKEVSLELWALLCGLRGEDDGAPREVLESRAMHAMQCPRHHAEYIVQHILSARSLAAGRTSYMADAPPVAPPARSSEYEPEDATVDDAVDTAIVCYDGDDVAAVHDKLVCALLELVDIQYPMSDDEEGPYYLEGTNNQADSADEDPELAAAAVHARRPEFLATALLADHIAAVEADLFKEAVEDEAGLLYLDEGSVQALAALAAECNKDAVEDAEDSGSDDLPDLPALPAYEAPPPTVMPAGFVEHECEIRPAQFALLVAEIGQDFKTDLTYDDRAFGLLYDASKHFLGGLFDAAAAQRRKRRHGQLDAGGDEEDEEAMLMRELRGEVVDATEDDEAALSILDLRAAIPEAIRKVMARGGAPMPKRRSRRGYNC